MKKVATDGNYFWIVDLARDNTELLDDCDSFAINNKIELGIYRESDQQISPRGFSKTLTIIEEV